MELAHSTIQHNYIKQVRSLESKIDKATRGELDLDDLDQAQKRLDQLAEKYQQNDQIGTAVYKLYELQAAIHYFNGNDMEALEFINYAIETRGGSYPSAENLKAQLLENGYAQNRKLPLELQSLIKSQRTSAIIMAIISVLSFYFIPWAFFYIYMATKLDPEEVPERGLVKTAAIATLPLCFGIIPIIIDVEFWKMNGRLKAYEELGAEVFKSDKEWLAGEPKRKRSNRIALSLLIGLVAIFFLLILMAVLSS